MPHARAPTNANLVGDRPMDAQATSAIYDGSQMPHRLLPPLMLLAASPHTIAEPDLTLMTFNVRYNNPADGDNSWPHRSDLVARVIQDAKPAALAIQEALPDQLHFLEERLSSFQRVGVARNGENAGEFSGLLIDTDKLELLDSGQIWLSETPEDPTSIGWDAALPRTATWARLRRWGSSDPVFLLIGTHFDHRGEAARDHSAALIVSNLDAWCDAKSLPVAIMGDLNALPESACLETFRAAGFKSAVSSPEGTFHGFSGRRDGPKIDYILLNDRWATRRADIIRGRADNRPASDHDAVLAAVSPLAPRGTIGRPRKLTQEWTPPHRILADLSVLPIPGPILESARKTESVISARGMSETDHHQLSHVLAGFQHPLALPELGLSMTDRIDHLAENPALIQSIAADMLDAPPQPGERPTGNRARAERALALLKVPSGTFYLEDESFSLLDLINESMGGDFGAIVASITIPGTESQPFFGKAKPPGATGTILAGERGANGWRVVGGSGSNTYDMNLIAEVFDMGGDDRYTAGDLVLGDRLVVDLGGDDIYTGTQHQGPAAGLFGTWIIDDRGGDDRYGQEGGAFSTGAAAFGVGMILDRDGNDVYMGTGWSIGAAVYGAGIILDLGSGNDRYLGDFMTDAVGGPRGFGFVFDEAGDDVHIANGPTPSVYDTPDVYASFSQGIGFGYRKYAAGGVGMLCDLAGDDHYEAGEFSQGGGYYHSLGVLRDFSGNDIYDGNRYAQGFGVHQAFGVLIDDAGDDRYAAMTAADQGSAWDIAAGALLERSGNDSYRADGLAQGSAAQQALAYLLDLGGNDTYICNTPGQGGSGVNTYHWESTRTLSFSLLVDSDGDDTYSLDRAAGAVTVTPGGAIPAAPNEAGIGICIDTRPGSSPQDRDVSGSENQTDRGPG